jgi:hypothetical protein
MKGKKMALDIELIDDIFATHEMTESQLAGVKHIQQVAAHLGKVIISHTPSGPSQTAAIRKIKEATMTAVFGITINGKF